MGSTLYDMRVSGCNANLTDCQFDVACSRWSKSKYEHTFEFWCTADKREKLWKSITPTAVDQFLPILCGPEWWDTTFCSGNTLKICPIHGVGTLSSMRSGNLFAVNDYMEDFVLPDTYHIRLSAFPVAGFPAH